MADIVVVLDSQVLNVLHGAGALDQLRRLAGEIVIPDSILWPILIEGCGDDMIAARRAAEIFAWVTMSSAQVYDTGGLVADPDGPSRGATQWLSEQLPEHLAAGRSVIAAHASGVDPAGVQTGVLDVRSIRVVRRPSSALPRSVG